MSRALAGQGALELARVVGLDERLQAEVERRARRAGRAAWPDGGRRAAGRGRRRPRGGVGSWTASTTNSLARTGHGDRGPDRPQVVDRAAEPVRLAQDRDRRRAAGLVGAGARDDVVVGRGDPAGRRRRALDLGDQVETGRGEAFGDRPRRGRGQAASIERPPVRSRELGQDVGAAAGGDLVDDVGRAARPAPGRSIGDGHAGARSVVASAAASAGCGCLGRPPLARGAPRAARSPRPASMVSAARSIPSSICSTTPADEQRGRRR